MFPPPPPYLHSSSASSRTTLARTHNPQANLTSLPAHILLQIIYHSFPQDPSLPPPSYLSPAAFSSSIHNQRKYAAQLLLYQPSKPERQRKTLYWLTTSLRLVSRQLYTACMHILRSTYLPSYQSLIRPPYTSDPFPFSLPAPSLSSGPPAYDSTPSFPNTPLSSSTFSSSSQSYSPLQTLHRETPILDRFIALKVRQDVLADESELHLDREDSFRDLFDVAQPRARLEDLVRLYGVREGLVSGYAEKKSPHPPQPKIHPIPFPSLSISFSPRRVGLVLNRSRTIAEVPRMGVGRERETLEVLARKLVGELKVALAG
ncbi:hypothetical protein CPB84DRAFT_1688877 [Gymnopilus junonius]|uniref:Uncharacterized protein n=1 Tax=Gymnopilus junonius TaxID=109634 RepID=A0A9P5NAI3_GYMJU|nr:hypothetical protein CPB84DRAFT_1688877 [Gymnopilus junonius]